MVRTSFKKLAVWQAAMDLAKEIYRLTAEFPQSEMLGFVLQLRSTAVNIPSQIAEGKKRRSNKDYLHYLKQAEGTTAKLETQILIAKDRYNEMDFTKVLELVELVQRMLNKIMRKIVALAPAVYTR